MINGKYRHVHYQYDRHPGRTVDKFLGYAVNMFKKDRKQDKKLYRLGLFSTMEEAGFVVAAALRDEDIIYRLGGKLWIDSIEMDASFRTKWMNHFTGMKPMVEWKNAEVVDVDVDAEVDVEVDVEVDADVINAVVVEWQDNLNWVKVISVSPPPLHTAS